MFIFPFLPQYANKKKVRYQINVIFFCDENLCKKKMIDNIEMSETN